MKIFLVRSYNKTISKFLFDIRKKQYVKKQLKKKSSTNFENHNKWLKNFITLKRGTLYLIKYKKISIGYIRIDKKKNSEKFLGRF